jgi:hypothetical protein
MNARTAIVGTALTLLAAPAMATTTSSGSRSSLRSFEDPALEAQRAGAVVLRAPLDETERATLRCADAASRSLEAQRAGDLTLSDRDLSIIAIAAAVILAIIIIA